MVFVVIYSFPYSLPVDALDMNYASLIAGAVSIFAAFWWFVRGGDYVGPKAMAHAEDQHATSTSMGVLEDGGKVK